MHGKGDRERLGDVHHSQLCSFKETYLTAKLEIF